MSNTLTTGVHEEGSDREGLDIAYQPLDSLRFETRLLLFHGETDDGKLICELVRSSLINPRKYAALSYRWDDSDGKSEILVGDTTISIAKSLEFALHQMQRHGETCVWVDAICINQDDDVEKGSQVRIMGKIYSQAYMVWISLGYASDTSDRAMHAFNTARAQFLDGQTFVPAPEDIDAMVALMQRPYFGRAWIIQELAKAESRWVICGNEKVRWVTLERVLAEVDDKLLPRYAREQLNALAVFRKGEIEGKMGLPRMLLLEAILRGRRSQAKRPRDKIYSLLGLTRDGDEVVPAPHYNGKIRDIHVQVARHFIVRQGLTSSLLLARLTDSKGEVPSWTTRWSSLPSDMPYWLVDAVAAERESFRLRKRYLSQDEEITVPGFVLETIATCANTDASPNEMPSTRGPHLPPPDSHIMKGIYCSIAMISEQECPPNYMEALVSPAEDVIPYSGESSKYVEWFTRTRRTLFGTKAVERMLVDFASSERFGQRGQSKQIAAAVRILKKGIHKLAHYDMEIVLTDRGMSRAVYKSAQVGDKICRLENCFLPIVLRDVGDGKYQCVGEVYVPYGPQEKSSVDQASSSSTAAMTHDELRSTYWLCENGWKRTKFGNKNLKTII